MDLQKIEQIHTCFKHPFTMCVSGATGSGKSEWIQRLFKNLPAMVQSENKNATIDFVLYCYGERNENVLRMQQKSAGYDDDAAATVRFQTHWGAPTEELVRLEAKRSRGRMLLVLDDLMVGMEQHFLDSIFTRGSHNWNMSVILVTQHLFNKELRIARSNSHYLVLMRNPAGALQIRNLASQLFPNHAAFLQEAYADATKRLFGYLLVDMHPTTPDQMRLRTHIYPEEAPQIVYRPKE